MKKIIVAALLTISTMSFGADRYLVKKYDRFMIRRTTQINKIVDNKEYLKNTLYRYDEEKHESMFETIDDINIIQKEYNNNRVLYLDILEKDITNAEVTNYIDGEYNWNLLVEPLLEAIDSK